ncbi:MAG: SDR family oxidoreductase, partial [Wenzhouxiangellaceae bacterium]
LLVGGGGADRQPRPRVLEVGPDDREGEHADDPNALRDILERVPLKRQGDPADIAAAVCFLALEAPYVTGQILAVDGGRMLNM